MPYATLIPLIAILPMAGFVFSVLFGRRLQARYGKAAASAVPLAVIALAWLAAMIVAVGAISGAAPFGEHGYGVSFWEWIPAGQFTVTVGFFVDSLTACLLIVVTTVGLLVHVYSAGYMSHDRGYWRFFAYLNLFMFSMLLLVLADNFLVIFVAWELVGLSSYLLIGFWFGRRSAALASKKAFIVNRVGDVGFILGICPDLGQPPRPSTCRRSWPESASSTTPRSAGSPSCCCAARWARAPSSRSTSGCPTRWRARPRSRP